MQTRVDVFEEMFLLFLGLGTLVGIIVVLYTLYNAYKYRDSDDREAGEDLPSVGELPTGGVGGKKLFLSFGLSAIIVISLVVWSYGMLLYVEDPGDNPGDDGIEVEVEGWAFDWDFYYNDGVDTEIDTTVQTTSVTEPMRVPADTKVWVNVTSTDVWHTFGISELRVKADAIPGEYDQTWFEASEPGEEYTIECFELCGPGHSDMEADMLVMEQDEFDDWLEEEAEEQADDGDDEEEEEETDEDDDNDDSNDGGDD
ncbi:cytochrome c oxidase subunit II [Natrialbaceae archaeon AArc-T1-2]|nr:cytochrome c oxidase subunit II [Natrialbaceae archaeon AArc-T1-2]WIV67947.1 cytochrome c oxidase subunit II [Natrialbaceae archaeon AArc-T1-2]